VFQYTTCRDCGGQLHTTDSDTVHPGCTPQPTKAERLAQDWFAAVEAGDDAIADDIQALIDEIDQRPPRLLEAALKYASWGWPVFPLKPRSKQPATPHGFKDATTDQDQIRAWWTRTPDANIGLPTGHAFDVIDIDVPDGTHSYIALRAQEDPNTGRGPIPDTHGHVATASGGIHLYVKPTGEGNTARIWPGIDHRGIGGYVVAPPSTLGQPGRAWSWTIAPSPTLTKANDVHA
jgi:hypothetical protein